MEIEVKPAGTAKGTKGGKTVGEQLTGRQIKEETGGTDESWQDWISQLAQQESSAPSS